MPSRRNVRKIRIYLQFDLLYSEPAFSGISKQLSVTSSSQARLLHSRHLTFKCQSCAFSAALDKGVHCLVLPHLPLRPFHILSHNYWEITHLQWKVSADLWAAWQAGQETDSFSWKLLWNHRWIVLSFLRPSAHNAELDQWHVSPDRSVREEKVTPAVHGFILMCVLYQSSLNHECRVEQLSLCSMFAVNVFRLKCSLFVGRKIGTFVPIKYLSML